MRTVRRWEHDRGLPVHRVPGGRGTSVFAYASEIDAWLRTAQPAKSDDNPESIDNAPALDTAGVRRRWPLALIAAATVMAVGVGALRLRSSTMRVEDLHVSITDEAIIAANANGVEMWRHAFAGPYRVAFNQYGRRIQTSSGTHPAVFALTGLRLRRSDDSVESGELFQFSPAGDLQGTFAFDDRTTFDHHEYGPPWAMTAIAVDDRGGTRRIAVAAHHQAWSASMVTILDDKLQRHGTYWQWGWIEHLYWIAPDRLLVGGFNDAKNGGMVALLDPATLNGQSPEEPDTHGYCQTCGTISPLKMAVMPRSELNRATESRFNRATIQLLPDRVVARTIEVPQGTSDAVDVLYEFTRDLTLTHASFSGPYLELHDALRARGQIDHDREHCPDRNGPRQILTWDRTAGWQHVNINGSE